MDNQMPLAIIIDLDSTLANVDHREIHAKRGEWDLFKEKVSEDRPNRWCVEIIESLQSSHPDLVVFFITGRTEELREVSEEWLRLHMSRSVLRNSHLHMRDEDEHDHRSIAKFKADVFERHIKGKYDVLFAIDDHISIIKTWRSLGIVALDCAGNSY
jgi:hypothetical protein